MQYTDFHFHFDSPDRTLPDQDNAVKWRRRGADRRAPIAELQENPDGYVEKRTSGDRRRHILERVSKIIFPRGKDGYGY